MTVYVIRRQSVARDDGHTRENVSDWWRGRNDNRNGELWYRELVDAKVFRVRVHAVRSLDQLVARLEAAAVQGENLRWAIQLWAWPSGVHLWAANAMESGVLEAELLVGTGSAPAGGRP